MITHQIKRFQKPLRAFALVIIFVVTLDACIALNRWWDVEGFQAYLTNLVIMLIGFSLLVILMSKSKIEIIGYFFLCTAMYFVCNYELGGPSKYYLTPFDPLLGVGRTFTDSVHHIYYRKNMAISTSIVAAVLLAIAKFKLTNSPKHDFNEEEI